MRVRVLFGIVAGSLIMSGVAAPPAAAVVTSTVASGALVVTGDEANDEIFIDCIAGSTIVSWCSTGATRASPIRSSTC